MKPRGMQVAIHRAAEVFAAGGKIGDCPYKSKQWRSAFCKEMQRLQQTAY